MTGLRDMDRAEGRFADLLHRHWLLLLFRGLAALAFGISAWLHPVVAFTVLTLLLGAYALVDGALAVWTAFSERREQPFWWAQLVVGLLGIVIGLFALSSPTEVASALLVAIALWAIASGITEIVVGLALRRAMGGDWRVVLSGIASLVIGIFFLARPNAVAITMHWLLTTYALVAGIILVILALRTRRKVRHAHR